MKLIKFVTGLAMLFLAGRTGAQHLAEIAHGSPYGIFVITGLETGSVKYPAEGITGYQVERKKPDNGSWTVIARVSAPDKESDFQRIAGSWCHKFPEWADVKRMPVSVLFKTMIRTGRIDSLRMWAQVLPVRLTTGNMFLDSTITDTAYYQYRISTFPVSGNPVVLYTSNQARVEANMNMGDIHLVKKVVTERDVALLWSTTSKPSFFRIYRKTGTAAGFQQIVPNTMRYSRNDTSYIMIRDTLVSEGSIYSYYIVPVSYYGRTGLPSVAEKTGVYNFNAIKAPYKIQTSPVLPAGGIRISWKFDNPSQIKSLLIYKSSDYDTGYTLLGKISPADSAYTDHKTDPMRKYFYYLTMEGHFGEESAPGIRVFGIAENKLNPFAPQVTAIGVKNGCRLEIHPVSQNTKGVRIYRRQQGLNDFQLVSPMLEYHGDPIVYTDTNKTFNGYSLLSYTVQAENVSYALSPFSDTVAVRPVGDLLPVSPDNIYGSAEGGRVNLVWDDVYASNPSIIGYRLYRKISGTTELIYDGFRNPQQNYFTDLTAVPGETYEYSVMGADVFDNESKTGPLVVIEVPVTRPVAPSAMSLTDSDEGLWIQWEEPAAREIFQYKIYRYQRGLKPVELDHVDKGTTQFLDKTARKGQLYFYYLTSVSKSGIESTPGREEGIWK